MVAHSKEAKMSESTIPVSAEEAIMAIAAYGLLFVAVALVVWGVVILVRAARRKGDD